MRSVERGLIEWGGLLGEAVEWATEVRWLGE